MRQLLEIWVPRFLRRRAGDWCVFIGASCGWHWWRRRGWRRDTACEELACSWCALLRRDLLWTIIIIRRRVITKIFQLELQQSLSLSCCFKFGALSCKLGLFLLCFFFCGLLAGLLLLLLDLARLHLLLKGSQTSLSGITLLVEIFLLGLGFRPVALSVNMERRDIWNITYSSLLRFSASACCSFLI